MLKNIDIFKWLVNLVFLLFGAAFSTPKRKKFWSSVAEKD